MSYRGIANMPGPGGSLGLCALCGDTFMAEILMGRKVQTVEIEALEGLALRYHKADPPNGEGEYGCPGMTCPGVQRLMGFARDVALAAVHSAYVSHRERCLINGCYYGLTANGQDTAAVTR